MSMDHVQATFISCVFQNNAAQCADHRRRAPFGSLPPPSRFNRAPGSTTLRNISRARFSADKSRVYIRDSQFIGNRVNVPGHSDFSAGGALHGNASTIHIANSRFENNQAGYVGGAIYVYGPWTESGHNARDGSGGQQLPLHRQYRVA